MYKFLPVCEWKIKYGRPCIICGMTHSFYAISKGDFNTALAYNNYSVYVYLLFFINNIIYIFIFLKSYIKLLGEKKHANS